MLTPEQNRINVKKWRKENPEKYKEQKRRYREKNPERYKEYRNKYNKNKDGAGYWNRKKYILQKKCQTKGFDFDLEWQDIKSLRSGNCIYCNSKNPVMTIDRKDNNIGYIKENCVACCWKCNSVKGGDLSFEEMLLIGNTIKSIKEKKPNIWNYYPSKR